MAITECGRGHLYDADQYPSCPYCQNGGNVIDFGVSDQGSKTAAVSGGFGPSSSQDAWKNMNNTVAPEDYRKKQEEENKTQSFYSNKIQLEPIVGWLVCIEGPDKGKDYKIWAKNNSVGRSEEMDICIKGDNTISRENHARVSYDPRHNNFYLIPAESTNNIYCNDAPVYLPTKLAPYDLIEFGNSKMVFVPFCCDKFTWEGLNRLQRSRL